MCSTDCSGTCSSPLQRDVGGAAPLDRGVRKMKVNDEDNQVNHKDDQVNHKEDQVNDEDDQVNCKEDQVNDEDKQVNDMDGEEATSA